MRIITGITYGTIEWSPMPLDCIKPGWHALSGDEIIDPNDDGPTSCDLSHRLEGGTAVISLARKSGQKIIEFCVNARDFDPSTLQIESQDLP